MPASYWVASTPETRFGPQTEDVTVDVAVVGAGITGLTAATLLKRAGKTVAVIEFDRVARGASGYNTAKLTAGHNLVFARLIKRFGEKKARLYAEANQAAIDFVEGEGIACDFRRRANFVYAAVNESADEVQREAEACERLGLPASYVTETSLPYAVLGAVRLDNQAEFHPRKYLLGLATRLPGEGSFVFDETMVVGVETGDPAAVATTRGTVRARDVVLASHMPFVIRGLLFARATPSGSYALVAAVDPADAPDGMFINTQQPTRSVRVVPDDGRTLLLVGGEGHAPGTEPDTRRRYAVLETFLRRHWEAGDVEQRWYTMDYVSVDGVPFVGRLGRRSERLWVGTGYGKWGLSNGTAAGILLADLVLGNENPWAELYDPSRLKPVASAPKLIKENTQVGIRFFKDRLARDRTSVDDIPRGHGALIQVDGRKAAVYRDDDGAVSAFSPVCTHLRCIVRWNTAERSWDCPCHGSRFDPKTGEVLHGPAVRPLERRGAPGAGGSSSSPR